MSGTTAQMLAMVLGLLFLVFALVLTLILLKANKKDKYVSTALPMAAPRDSVTNNLIEDEETTATPQFSFETLVQQTEDAPQGRRTARRTPKSEQPALDSTNPSMPSRRSLRTAGGAPTPSASKRQSFFDEDDSDINFGEIGKTRN